MRTEAERPDVILKKLNAAGFAAYYVGGCVRDRLLGRPVHDWDITTEARPEAVMALFSHCIPTGIRHGTVTVLEGGVQAEVTTFRSEGAYLDGRHPSEVCFVPRLEEDLSRRDFTINAMAMDVCGEITDLYSGQEDLARKLVRCVGCAQTRFQEDALRMLRAYRFCAQLGFSMEKATREAAWRCAQFTAALSMERVRDEVEKTLLSPRPQMLKEMAEAGLLRSAGIQALPDCGWLAELPAEAAVRWTGLKVLYPRLEPVRLRLPGRLCTQIQNAAAAYAPEMDALGLKHCIAKYGWETAEITAALAGKTAELEMIRASGDCVTLRQLALSGRDLPQLHGHQIGQMLSALLEHVLRYPEDNTRETLLMLSQQIYRQEEKLQER